MSVTIADLWGWAKTNRKPADDPAFEWLSVVEHGRDVAAVFEALVRGAFHRGLIHAFGRGDEALIGDLTGLVGLHDLGKVSWTFQGRENGPTPLARERRFDFEHHTDEACALLQEQHRARLIGWRDALQPVADLENPADLSLLAAVFSHHGKPRNGRELITLRNLPDRFLPLAGDLRDPRELARRLVAAFPPRTGPGALAGLPPDRQRFACHWLMGLVNLADWIGSNADWFPLRPRRRPDFDHVAAATEALATIGLDGDDVVEAAEDDATAVARTLTLYTDGKATSLRPAQARVVDAILAKPLQPGDVLVLEEETGGGKTLAAYLVHALLARRGLVQGLTFCLPTRASAKAIHDGALRVYGGGRLPPVLALPGYDEAAESRLSAEQAQERAERELPWAQRSRHRFLVAPVAVATVDQVLLGTLTVPYAHLRSCAVARNLLVVDEVHSSDPYMRELLAEAVARQRRQGGITLLMSATLGAELRARLLASGTPAPSAPRRHGSRWAASISAPDPDSALTAPYPVLWRGEGDPVCLAEGEPPQKAVRVELSADWPLEAVERVAARAVEAARAGARVLVIRNTVRLARATAMAVRDLAPEPLLRHAGHPVCHHARYARPDRLALDEALRAALHPDPATRAPLGVIAVTTQTAEQSLDVDADLLITDLVPADVLLQRIGRLHRNRAPEAAAARPEAYREARCVALAPERPETLLSFTPQRKTQPNNWGIDRAYANLLALAATQEQIKLDGSWSIPSNNRRLVERATTEIALRSLASRYGQSGDEAFRLLTGKTLFEREQAKRAQFTFSDDPIRDLLCERFDQPNEVATRLGLRDVRLTFANPFTSPFGNPVDAVTAPGHIALGLKIEGDREASWTAESEHAVMIALDGHGVRFTYGPFGLDLAPGRDGA